MAVYVNDAIWRRLSDYYNVTADQAQVGDLYKRWLDEKGLNWGTAGDYFISQFPGMTRGDAEFMFWSGGFGEDLVLLLDAAQEPQTGTVPQYALNRGDTRVPAARYGSTGKAELRGVYNGLLLPGVAGNYASATAADVGNPTSQLDVRVRARLGQIGAVNDWVCKGFGVAAQAGYVIRQNGANMTCFVSTDGSNFSRTLSGAHGLDVGGSAWFRMVYDGSTGQMWLYKADDQDGEPDVWTLLASNVFTAGNVHASTQDLRVGASSANTNAATGAVLRAVVRHSLGSGVAVFDADFVRATPLVSSFTASTGQIVTVTAGTGVDNGDPTLLQHAGTNYVFLPGVAGNDMTIPADTSNAFTTELDYIVRLDRLWAGAGTNSGLIGRYGSSSGAHVALGNSNGTVNFTLHDGTAYVSVACSAKTSGDGARWLRVTWRSSDGRVQFFFNADQPTVPTVWTQLGVDATLAAGATITQSTANFFIGANVAVGNAPCKVLYGSAAKTIGGVPTVVVDTSIITNGNQTSFTAITGQTVTINRSTSGRKSVAVVRPVWLLGTDDFFEIPDTSLLDFGANDSFTVLALMRVWGSNTPYASYANKISWSGSPGYSITTSGSGTTLVGGVSDGTTKSATMGHPASGSVQLVSIVVNKATEQLVLGANGVYSSPTSISGVGSADNLIPFVVGRTAAGSVWYGNFELLAVAVVRRALTATELANIQEYYNPNPIVTPINATSDVTAGGYRTVTWETSGSLTVAGAPLDVEYLVVAGGGGGSFAGGGAGGVLSGSSLSLSTTSHAVTVGAGGAFGGTTVQGSDGNTSSIGSLVVATGGGGSGGFSSSLQNGRNGGSGGGAGLTGSLVSGAAGLGVAGQGNDGGFPAGGGRAAGGGGATAAGTGGSPNVGGVGGNGVVSSISGSSVTYGGGGGGGAATTGGVGGSGGGGQGEASSPFVASTAGTNGLGGGGGGGYSAAGKKGGDGIVIVRWAV